MQSGLIGIVLWKRDKKTRIGRRSRICPALTQPGAHRPLGRAALAFRVRWALYG